MGEGGSFRADAARGGTPDAFDYDSSNYSYFGINPALPLNESQSPSFQMDTLSLQTHFLPNDATVFSGDIQLLGNEDDTPQQSLESGYDGLDDIHLAVVNQSESIVGTEAKRHHFSHINFDSQSPTSCKSSGLTTETTNSSTAITAETIKCDIESCGRVCKDHKSLK